MSALQQISARLLQVPKQARHAALKAELTLLNQELPAEVDIPLLVPSDTMRKNPTHHRIVRVPPAESAVLNSAERVPFLILIEYLEDDMTFDPECAKNKEVLEHADKKKYIFDLTVNHKNRLMLEPLLLDDTTTRMLPVSRATDRPRRSPTLWLVQPLLNWRSLALLKTTSCQLKMLTLETFLLSPWTRRLRPSA